MADNSNRSTPLALAAFAAGAALVVGGAALFRALAGGRYRPGDFGSVTPPAGARAPANPAPPAAEHVPTDLLGDTHPGPEDRAPAAFRPDMSAPMSAAEREALRPITPQPTDRAASVAEADGTATS